MKLKTVYKKIVKLKQIQTKKTNNIGKQLFFFMKNSFFFKLNDTQFMKI